MIIQLEDIDDLHALQDYDLLEKIVDLDGYGKDNPKFEGDCVTVEIHVNYITNKHGVVFNYVWNCFREVKQYESCRPEGLIGLFDIGKPGEQRATAQEFIDFIRERCK